MRSVAVIFLMLFAAASRAQYYEWEHFKAHHKKTYLSTEHESHRRAIFMETLKNVRKHNFEADLKMHSWYLGINKFADMTDEEVSQKLTGFKYDPTPLQQEHSTEIDLTNFKSPESKNWVEEGYVSHVVDQGNCGSCYAFSATATIEGQYKKRYGELVKFSEQSMLDCTYHKKCNRYSNVKPNRGCKGGAMSNCFACVTNVKGMMPEDSYRPYNGTVGKCQYDEEKAKEFTVWYYKAYTRKDELRIKRYSASIGPISGAMSTGGLGMKSYKRGVYSPRGCPNTINHAINIVGYGTEKGKDYWLIRNSWGDDWGDDGYMKLRRNKCKCGICTQINYLVFED